MKKKRNDYSEYSDKTQKFMSTIIKHLTDKFGSIEPQWDGVLDMIAAQYDLFFDCKRRIREDGLLVPDARNVWKTHPLVQVQNNANIQLLKLIQEFGITPKSLKSMPIENNNEDEFLNSLTSGD